MLLIDVVVGGRAGWVRVGQGEAGWSGGVIMPIFLLKVLFY